MDNSYLLALYVALMTCMSVTLIACGMKFEFVQGLFGGICVGIVVAGLVKIIFRKQ